MTKSSFVKIFLINLMVLTSLSAEAGWYRSWRTNVKQYKDFREEVKNAGVDISYTQAKLVLKRKISYEKQIIRLPRTISQNKKSIVGYTNLINRLQRTTPPLNVAQGERIKKQIELHEERIRNSKSRWGRYFLKRNKNYRMLKDAYANKTPQGKILKLKEYNDKLSSYQAALKKNQNRLVDTKLKLTELKAVIEALKSGDDSETKLTVALQFVEINSDKNVILTLESNIDIRTLSPSQVSVSNGTVKTITGSKRNFIIEIESSLKSFTAQITAGSIRSLVLNTSNSASNKYSFVSDVPDDSGSMAMVSGVWRRQALRNGNCEFGYDMDGDNVHEESQASYLYITDTKIKMAWKKFLDSKDCNNSAVDTLEDRSMSNITILSNTDNSITVSTTLSGLEREVSSNNISNGLNAINACGKSNWEAPKLYGPTEVNYSACSDEEGFAGHTFANFPTNEIQFRITLNSQDNISVELSENNGTDWELLASYIRE